MFFKQYYLGCLAHASYMIGDEKTGQAVVVDPKRDVEDYIQDAEQNGLRIAHVILTHFHADFIAGHLELRDRVGAKIHLGASARAEYHFVAEADGSCLELGEVRLQFLETPGHTPEGLCILVYDLPKSREAPEMVLTGDTLFIGDVGRPDLMASEGISEEALASSLYLSLHRKLMPLPEQTQVYPAHGAGSMCGKKLSDETVSTIGEQKRLNYALQPMSQEEFVAMVTENLPAAPQYFAYDARLNKKERQNLEQSLECGLRPLGLDEFLDQHQQGHQVLDTRPDADFNAAHFKGALQVGLGGKFASWVGVLLTPDIPLLIVADPGAEYESEMRLGRIGFDRVTGFLQGGMTAFEGRPDMVESVTQWTTKDFFRELESGSPLQVIDVRTAGEYRDIHLEQAENIPLNGLQERLSEVSMDKTILVHCAAGYRSTIACSLLKMNGYAKVVNLIGGMGALEKCAEKFKQPLVVSQD